MKKADIKYIIARYYSGECGKIYISPYGKICIVSEDPDSYVLLTKSKSMRGIDKLIKFYDTRREARNCKYDFEFVVKVRVKNYGIIEWIKKNP